MARPLPGHVKRAAVPEHVRLDDFFLYTREGRLDAEWHEYLIVEFIRSTCLAFRPHGKFPQAVEVFPPLPPHHRAWVFGQGIGW
ncbi:MAG: hypothetical protein ACYSWZ_13810 [Planctomycetota bacterium]